MALSKRPVFVFGKGRTSGARREKIEKVFIPQGEVSNNDLRTRGIGTRHRMYFARAVKKDPYSQHDGKAYPVENSSINEVEQQTKFPIRKTARKKFKDKNFIVVDWGCGKGQAITDLASEFPNARAYGFSKHAYPEMKTNEHVKFIHGEETVFKRYFKNDSVDYMYSNLGLFHVKPDPLKYVIRILPILKKGGILVTTLPFVERDDPNLGKHIIEIGGMQFKLKLKRWTYKRGDYRNIWHHNVLIAERIK